MNIGVDLIYYFFLGGGAFCVVTVNYLLWRVVASFFCSSSVAKRLFFNYAAIILCELCKEKVRSGEGTKRYTCFLFVFWAKKKNTNRC